MVEWDVAGLIGTNAVSNWCHDNTKRPGHEPLPGMAYSICAECDTPLSPSLCSLEFILFGH